MRTLNHNRGHETISKDFIITICHLYKTRESKEARVSQEFSLKKSCNKVTVQDQKVLVVRTQGQYFAVGGRCSHYNAPLIKGALVGERVRCPFHGACFNVRTGDIEDYPGLDSLPTYKVKQHANTAFIIKLCLKFTDLKEICFCSFKVRSFVIFVIFLGPASLVCAETLRQNCYQGRIIMVTKDSLPPYDKTKLSKVMNVESSSILLRPAEFYQQYGIEVWTNKEVVSVNPGDKLVKMNDGALQHYDQLLISTGSRPLSCPGSDLKGVHLLQSYDDAKEIHSSGTKQKAVVIGASFIGVEVAAYLSDKAAGVALVGPTQYPFEKSLGPEIGRICMEMLEERNVKFYMNSKVTEIRGENGKVKEVVLNNGTVLEADVVLAGIGVIPNSGFLAGTEIAVDSNKAVIVDKFMRTNTPDIFAAGDVTSFPLTIRGGEQVNIGHWQMSQAHGKIAGLNMMKKPTPIESVPFFWTSFLGKSIRYTGCAFHGTLLFRYTEIIFKGKVEERKFLAFYIKKDVVVAASSLMFDPAVAQVAELMSKGNVITKAQAQ
uniref:Apoptosis inducing factor mitochondria associated 4 n=1 Tax=Oryzias sinensis TaxID=183150 RepID=A0A8C7YHZ2_9TELE